MDQKLLVAFQEQLSSQRKARLAECGWRLVDAEEAEMIEGGLRERYSYRNLLPLLRRDDTDDVLCADLSSRPSNEAPVIQIHNYAEPGWENEGEWPDLNEWARGLD